MTPAEMVAYLDVAGALGKAVTSWVTPIVAVLGWYFVDRRTNGRETRKELRQQVDRVATLIDVIGELSGKIYGPDVKDNTLQNRWKLKKNLGQLSNLIQSLKEQGLHSSDSTDALLELLDALTGDDFETSGQKQWAADDVRWTTVNGEGIRLFVGLQKAYQQRFGLEGEAKKAPDSHKPATSSLASCWKKLKLCIRKN